MAMGIGGRAHRRGPVHGLQGLPAAGAASVRQRVLGPGIGGMKTAAFVIKALALLIGLLSIYGLWAAVNDLRGILGLWCFPVLIAALVPWVWLWSRIARHMHKMPDPEPVVNEAIQIGRLDRPMQSLALVLILTTPLFVYILIRGLIV